LTNSAGDGSVLFDTDVFIWAQRGNVKAATAIERESVRFLSVQTYLELFQDARNKAEQQTTKQLLADFHLRSMLWPAVSGLATP
jgi:predicted nucleic acid-binding protein